MLKVNVDVPKIMLAIAEQANENQKPHDICLNCPFMHTSCAGPGILSMGYLDWVEWINALAKQQRLTHSIISERSGIAKGTVDSVLSGKNKDVRFATVRDITRVVVGEGFSRFPCHFAAQLVSGEIGEDDTRSEELAKDLEKALEELSHLREALGKVHDSYRVELEAVRKDEAAKIAHLCEEIAYLREENTHKDKIIERLLVK